MSPRVKGSADEDDVVRYLLSGGVVLASSVQEVVDPLDERHPVIGTRSIMTDEVWDWPDYLPALVQKYHVALPEEFLKRVKHHRG